MEVDFLGENGCILIDTLESCQAAEEVKKHFASKTSKPIKAIILTHFHPDHTYGVDTFLEDGVEVYAHEKLKDYFQQLSNVRSKITTIRSTHQFGTQLKYGHRENAGIGFELKFGNDSTMSTKVQPTHTFKDQLRVSKCGIELELHHAPGETNDQIIVWLPKRKILFPADNIYRAFPNLYAIRGTMSRDTMQWVRAVDLMRKLRPRVLVPQHTQPIVGEEEIAEILTAYRDAIQYVHDQTVRFMNKGWHPNAIAHHVRLPDHLASHPFLQQFYGTVEWSVRAVFDHYMGWFSGSAVDLHPLETKAKAERVVKLAGGPDSLLDKCKSALADGDFQWALELSDTLISANHHVTAAKETKCMSLRRLAAGEISACGRNWYLTAALVEEGLDLEPSPKLVKQRIYSSSIQDLFLMMTVLLDADKAKDVQETVVFNFSDTKEKVVMKIRRGIVEQLEDTDEPADVTVTTTERIWREIVAKDRMALGATVTRNLVVEPSIRALARFVGYFELPK